MALTKVTEVTLLTLTNVASNSNAVGSAIDVSTYYQGDVRIRMGRTSATAFTAAPKLRMQKTYKTSPTANDWVTDVEFTPALGATIGSQAVSGTANAGATSVTLAAGTNFAAGDFVFFQNSTLGNSEWCRVNSIATATLTLIEGLVNAQTGSTCRNQAEEYTWVMDLLGVQKARFFADCSGTGQTVAVEAAFGTLTAL